MREHEKFILTPITSILNDDCYAMSVLEDGLETFPISEYMMQSLFLRMTGFQEQKVKCILWELATDDYELRYRRFNKEQIGEASTYSDKIKVFGDLAKATKALLPKGGALGTDEELGDVIDSTLLFLKDLSEQRFMKGWSRKQYGDCVNLFSFLGKECLLHSKGETYEIFARCDNCKRKSRANDGSICKKSTLRQVYDFVYKHRNRCAHNTVSYQQNLPSLEKLQDKDYIFENYFVRFAILIIIDKMFVLLFKKYIDLSPKKFVL